MAAPEVPPVSAACRVSLVAAAPVAAALHQDGVNALPVRLDDAPQRIADERYLPEVGEFTRLSDIVLHDVNDLGVLLDHGHAAGDGNMLADPQVSHRNRFGAAIPSAAKHAVVSGHPNVPPVARSDPEGVFTFRDVPDEGACESKEGTRTERGSANGDASSFCAYCSTGMRWAVPELKRKTISSARMLLKIRTMRVSTPWTRW